MAMGMIFGGPSMTKEQYDQITQQVMPTGEASPGMLYHAAGTGEDGFYVFEIWESQEAFQQVFASKLAPAFQQANLDPNLRPTFFDVVNVVKA